MSRRFHLRPWHCTLSSVSIDEDITFFMIDERTCMTLLKGVFVLVEEGGERRSLGLLDMKKQPPAYDRAFV